MGMVVPSGTRLSRRAVAWRQQAAKGRSALRGAGVNGLPPACGKRTCLYRCAAHSGAFGGFMRHLVISLVFGLLGVVALVFAVRDAAADTTRQMPSFSMKDLSEVQHRLTDERFQNRPLLVTAFGTWQQVSIEQARELQAFHAAHPEVEIIAFVMDALPEARDFVARHGLTFPCYQPDPAARLDGTLNRLFNVRTGRTLTLNRVPFVLLTDRQRNVHLADIGLVKAERLTETVRAFR
jgi:hypothetical protein